MLSHSHKSATSLPLHLFAVHLMENLLLINLTKFVAFLTTSLSHPIVFRRKFLRNKKDTERFKNFLHLQTSHSCSSAVMSILLMFSCYYISALQLVPQHNKTAKDFPANAQTYKIQSAHPTILGRLFFLVPV